MQYIVSTAEQEYRIEVAAQEGSLFRLSVDGAIWEVDCVRISDRSYSLLIDGSSCEVDLITASNPYTIGIQGEAHEVEVLSERERRLKAVTRKAAEGPGGRRVIAAPMPSKVVKLLVAVGDQVKAGDGVIVVEAMKMENELRVAGPGIVKEIRAKEGEAVGGGQALVVIE